MFYRYRAIFVIVAVLAAGAYFLSGGERIERFVDYIGTLPYPLALLFAVCFVALGTVLLVPNSVLFVSTGLLFGAYLGTLLNLLGFAIGSSLAFLIARHIARDFILSHSNAQVMRVIDEVSNEGWRAVAILRLVPGLPSFLINYVLGVTNISLVNYAWATLLFILPAMAVLSYAGATGRAIMEGDSPLLQVFIAISLLIVVVILRQIVRRRVENRSD